MSLTITIPYRNTDNDAVKCEYFAIQNPVNVKCERKDFAVVNTQDDGSGNTQINITGTLPTLTVGGKLFVNIGTFGVGLFGTFDILTNSAGAVVIDVPFASVFAGGYVNLITDRPNYFIYTRIQTVQPIILGPDGSIPYIYRKDVPDNKGVAMIDVAENMRSKFFWVNDFLYLALNDMDSDNCVFFSVEFIEMWTGSLNSFSAAQFIGAVNASMQIQNNGGSNMQLYLPTNAGNHKAKFLLDSPRIRRWEGLPFDIHSLLGFNLVDGTNAPFLSTHEVQYTNGISGSVTDTPLTGITSIDQLIQRYTMLGGYAANIDRVNFSININNFPTTYTNVTEEIQVRIEHDIPCNPVYLMWLSKKGGPHYWCFGKRQQLGKKTASDGEFTKAFDDLELQDTTSSFLSKSSEPYMIAGCERLDSYDMLLMDSLTDSPRVMMLMNIDTWITDGPLWQEVKVATDDYKLRDTKKTFNNFELKIRLPETFIQRN